MKIRAKKGKNTFSISKFIQKIAKMKKESTFIWIFRFFLHDFFAKKVENIISKNHAKKGKNATKNVWKMYGKNVWVGGVFVY